MAQDKTPPKSAPKKPPTSEEDLEKTVVDVNIHDLEKKLDEEAKAEKKEPEGLDETVMVKMPPLDEDQDLFDEDTGAHKVRIHAAEEPEDLESTRLIKMGDLSAPQAPPKQKIRPKKSKPKAASPKPSSPVVKARSSNVYLGFGLIFLLFLFLGVDGSLRRKDFFEFPQWLSLGIGVVAFIGMVLGRFDSFKAFLWLVLASLGGFAFLCFAHLTSTTPYFLEVSLSALLGPVLVVWSILVAALVWREKEIKKLFRWPAMIGGVLILSAFLLSFLSGQTLEENLWGPAWLSFLPFFLRPTVLALALAFPLQTLSVFLMLFRGRQSGASLLLLLLCVIGSLLGARLLARQGLALPLMDKAVKVSFLGNTQIDPSRLAINLDLKPTEASNQHYITFSSNWPKSAEKKSILWLTAKNQEGHPWLRPNLENEVNFERGGKKISGVKIKLDPARLAQPRHLALILDIATQQKPETKLAMTGSIFRLAKLLSPQDRLYLVVEEKAEVLVKKKPESWPQQIKKTLMTPLRNQDQLVNKSIKKLSDLSGIRQLIYLSDSNKLPPSQQRQTWTQLAQKEKVAIDFVTFGEGDTQEAGLYHGAHSAALGFNLLAAASRVFGNYQIIVPRLPPLPITKSVSPESDKKAEDGLKFISPLDQDAIRGLVEIIILPTEKQKDKINYVEFLLNEDSLGRVNSEPYTISWDSRLTTPGVYSLQAIANYTDGTSESIRIQVQVDPQIPPVKIVRPGRGEYLSNLAEVEAEVEASLFEQPEKVEFLINGNWIGEAAQAPYRFLWANANQPAGQVYLQVRAHFASQSTTTDAVLIQLAQTQGVVQADLTQNPDGQLFPDHIGLLMDVSQRMGQSLGGMMKLDLVKFALASLQGTLPNSVQLKVYALGGSLKKEECGLNPALQNSFQAMEFVSPLGKAPLALGIDQIGKGFKKTKGSRIVLLVTDGWDNCQGDPFKVVHQLRAKGEEFIIHVLYYSTNQKNLESQLKRLADIAGGKAYAIKSPEDLIRALRDAVQINFALWDYKNQPVIQGPLSQEPFVVRTGTYRLQVDTVPPTVLDNVSFSPGIARKFILQREGEKFRLREE